jgi:hypothetical protein
MIEQSFHTDNGAYVAKINGWHQEYTFDREFLKFLPQRTTFKTEPLTDNADIPWTHKISVFRFGPEEALYESKDCYGVREYWVAVNPVYYGCSPQLKRLADLREAKEVATRLFGPARPWEEQ